VTARSARRLLLVGAGYTARIVAAELVRAARGEELVGVLDDDPARLGEQLGPTRVVGPLASLETVATALDVDEVVIAIPSLSGARLGEIALTCRALGLSVRTMPGIIELLGQPLTPRQLRPVELGDLLRRTEVRCDDPPPAWLGGTSVLITGAGGSIGRELARQVCRAAPAEVVLLGHGENSIHAAHTQLSADPTAPRLTPVIADIRDRRALARVFAAHRPSVVFHAAAHKHVPLMEAHAAEATFNNVIGTAHVVRCAEESGVARVLLVSTDKAVAPASVMGATKRVCEWIVRDAALRTGRRYISVRFGNVLGSRGSVVPLLEQQIAAGGPITLTHPDTTRFFMTIPEAVYLVLQAAGLDDGGDIYALDMGAPVRIVDLASQLMALSGLAPGALRVVYTGLRPGEKLAEALWEEGSDVQPAGSGDLFRIAERAVPPSGEALAAIVRRLRRAAVRGDARGLHDQLRRAIPSFVSSLAGAAPVTTA
jgi:FlaA1/EpsC-like NDP-sugar epimerase